MLDALLERWTRGGWRGPALAALFALLAALPGAVFMPTLDRDEARFAEASAQMIETHDFVTIRFQDEPRFKKPVGIHWIQAALVTAFSPGQVHDIWAYRLASLLGAMGAAAACAWGAQVFLGPRGGFLAGAVLGASLLLSTEAMIAKTDAVLCAFVTLMMAALGRIYAASKGEAIAGKGTKAVFWLGLALAILVKGPIGPMVAVLSIAALWIWDRRAPWLADLGWTWGAALVLLIVGPWAMAVTVATDGAFWSGAVMGDMLSKLGSGQEGHGAPPGLHALLSPLLLFPTAFLLPAALVLGWRRRGETGVRFALCWLAPAWLVFELTPTKLPHYPLPLYGALALLIAAAAEAPPVDARADRIASRVGAGLQAFAAVPLAGAGLWAASLYGTAASVAWAVIVAVLIASAGVAGVAPVIAPQIAQGRTLAALLAALGLGALAHDALAGGLAPSLKSLWVSQRAAEALAAAGIDPRNGVTPGPVAVAGYAEPSLVFLLGARTELTDGPAAADAIADGRPAIVEAREQAAFLAALKAEGSRAALAGEVKGLNYSKGKAVDLFLYRSLEPR
jgi:4-amino-4-deoxy-L-arabinose transferase-like glycosyltransferase